MRIATKGEVWEWCSWDSSTHGTMWEPVLLLKCLGMADNDMAEECGLHDWMALDLLTGMVETVFNVPQMGWEKVE